MTNTIRAADWYEVIPFADGVSLIHEPWIEPFFRCNMWHMKGRDRDMIVDSGLGHFSLRAHVPLLNGRPIVCVASHAHFDHIGCNHEFPERLAHPGEAEIYADPRGEWTLAKGYATDAMFIARPEGWVSEEYTIPPAPLTGTVEDGDIIDLGDRHFEVIHTPGHSPGGIALFERATGTLIAGDILYDGALVDDTFHSDRAVYRATLDRLRDLPVTVVHGGHFQSFGAVRFRQLIDAYRP